MGRLDEQVKPVCIVKQVKQVYFTQIERKTV